MKFNLLLNTSKHLPPKQLIHDYSLHNQVLESISSIKYVDITDIDDLDWCHHINNITSKATKTLSFSRRNFSLPEQTLIRVCNTNLEPLDQLEIYKNGSGPVESLLHVVSSFL